MGRSDGEEQWGGVIGTSMPVSAFVVLWCDCRGLSRTVLYYAVLCCAAQVIFYTPSDSQSRPPHVPKFCVACVHITRFALRTDSVDDVAYGRGLWVLRKHQSTGGMD